MFHFRMATDHNVVVILGRWFFRALFIELIWLLWIPMSLNQSRPMTSYSDSYVFEDGKGRRPLDSGFLAFNEPNPWPSESKTNAIKRLLNGSFIYSTSLEVGRQWIEFLFHF